MASRFSLLADEIRIIGHSINWRLNGPYERTSPPDLSEDERQLLRILFNELCKQRMSCEFGTKKVVIEFGIPYLCDDGRMTLPQDYFRLLSACVGLFSEELHHSPTELEIVTGLPAAATFGLFSRMQATLEKKTRKEKGKAKSKRNQRRKSKTA